MNNSIDIAVLVLFLYYFWRGWKKGLLGSVLGPISLILGCILSYAYFLKTQNVVISLAISLFSPIFLQGTVAILLKIWSIPTPKKNTLSLTSRLIGSAVSLAWSGGMIIVLILLIMVIPSGFPYAGKTRDVLSETKTYALINYYAHQNSLQNEPEKMERLVKTDEFKKVIEDDHFKEIMNDPDIQKYLKEKDIEGLMNDKHAREKMAGMLNNRDLVMMLFEFQKKMIEDSMGLEGFETKDPPKPKTITIENRL
ncbi:MAG: hypothetical protein AB7S78_08565 [Candidatus Omnitrophota bacterium]